MDESGGRRYGGICPFELKTGLIEPAGRRFDHAFRNAGRGTSCRVEDSPRVGLVHPVLFTPGDTLPYASGYVLLILWKTVIGNAMHRYG